MKEEGSGFHKDTTHKIYASRWNMLAMFSFINFCNALMWVTFAPISDITEDYFGCSTTAVNMLAIIFQILYVPGTILGSMSMKSYGMRNTLIFGGLLLFCYYALCLN